MSKSKAKGTSYETAVRTYLNERGIPAYRRAMEGKSDKGDLGGVSNWTLELKNHKSVDLAAFLNEAKQEAENAGTDYFAAIVKRRGKNVSESYVVLPLSTFCDYYTAVHGDRGAA